jgi:hypothetical protein
MGDENVAVTETRIQIRISNLNSKYLFACKWLRAPATIDDEGLADAAAASPFIYPDFTQESVCITRPRRRPWHPADSLLVGDVLPQRLRDTLRDPAGELR